MTRRKPPTRLAGIVFGALALLITAAASGAPVNAYTVASEPAIVKRSTAFTYTIRLTNNADSPESAQRARIGVPAGFTLSSMTATTSPAGSCEASTWELVSTVNGTVEFKRPGGGSTELCPGGTLTVSIDASAPTEGIWTWTTELLRSTAFALQGSQPTVRVDGTPPVASIDASPANPSNVYSASFTFSADESGVAFKCKLDESAFAECVSPKAYPSLTDSMHSFSVQATDQAGNVGSPASYAWTVDTVPPETSIAVTPPSLTNSSTGTFTFSASEPSTFGCKLDLEADFSACAASEIYVDLHDGQHVLAVRARDTAGNVDPSPASHAWTVDTAAPQTTIGNTPPNPSASEVASFTFSSSEPSSTFECRMDSGSYTACSASKSYSLLDGPHTFEVRATDAAKNTDTTAATYSWRIDTAEPDTTITSAPSGSVTSGDTTITFSSDEPNTVFECQLDGGAYAPCVSPKSYENLQDGQHTFSVRAIDRAGNVDPTPATRTWTIDTVAPAVTLSLPIVGSVTNDPTPAFAGTAGTALGDMPKVTVSVYAGSVVTGTPLGTFDVDADRVGGSWSGASGLLADGLYTARAEQRDAAGNTGYSAPTTFTVDTGGPGVAITERPVNPSGSTTATFRITSTDPAATFRCRLDAGDFVPCPSLVTYQGLSPGGHVFAVNATDRAGNTGGNATYSWTIVVPAPPPPPPPPPLPPPPAAVPPAAPDVVPPQEVARVRVKATNATVTLTWALPADPDFDRVSVTRTAPGKRVRAIKIYQGRKTTLTDRRLKNGVRYRYRIATHDRAGNRSAGLEVAATPQAPLVAPLNGASLTAPPLLRWQPTPRATYYNVQVWFIRISGQAKAARPVKVLSAWPSAPRLKLSSRWKFEGKAYRFVPGRYWWYVFPGFGKRSAGRYGDLLGQSTFTVKARHTGSTR